MLNQLSCKGDCFAFGVCLLRLVTGRPAYSVRGAGSAVQMSLLHEEVWAAVRAAQAAKQELPIDDLVDSRCTWEPPEVAAGLLRLGLHCTESERGMRPPMADVVLALRDLMEPEGGFSVFYSRPELLRSQPAKEKASPSTSATQSSSSTAEVKGVRVCFTCGDRPRTTVFEPCRHAMNCQQCASSALETARAPGGAPALCPLCRVRVVAAPLAAGPIYLTLLSDRTPALPFLRVPHPSDGQADTDSQRDLDADPAKNLVRVRAELEAVRARVEREEAEAAARLEATRKRGREQLGEAAATLAAAEAAAQAATEAASSPLHSIFRVIDPRAAKRRWKAVNIAGALSAATFNLDIVTPRPAAFAPPLEQPQEALPAPPVERFGERGQLMKL